MIWKPISGYEGRYEVSNEGQVRGLRLGRILRPFIKSHGSHPGSHLCVNLSKPGNHRWVHRLVLEAFVGPCPPGMQGRHFPDPDPANNRLENLSWATPLTNQRDRDVHGTNNKGVRNYSAKLDEEAVRQIRTFKKWPYGLLTVLAEQYGVTPTAIAYARDYKSWEHV
jgi:hypothetical protein